MREELLSAAMKSGVLLEPSLVDYLASQAAPMDSLMELLETVNPRPLVLTLGEVEAMKLPPQSLQPLPEPMAVPTRLKKSPVRREDHDAQVQVLKDVTGRSTCTGEMKDFSQYFSHRFRTLAVMLRQRRELAGAVSIGRAKKSTRESRFIGIVQEARRTKAGHLLLRVEDEEDTCQVLLPRTGGTAEEHAVTDEVLGIIARPWRQDVLLAESVLRPDVPRAHAFAGASEPLLAAFISDLHIGSKLFLEEKWVKFLQWLRDPQAKRVKYLVLVGDAVDGIGVYPRQDEDLALDDVYLQYEALAAALSELPDHLQVIISPGNHDAVRPAEPQPALPEAVQKLFPSDYIFVGNPASLRLHGVDVLCYHGRSMDDFVTSFPGMSYDRPLTAMIEMLRRRHLAPIYGGKTPLAPEQSDLMIVDPLPSIFATGHVHGLGVGQYRGVTMVNSSTWQSQTSYQRMHNIAPRPGMVPVVDLQTGQTFVKAF